MCRRSRCPSHIAEHFSPTFLFVLQNSDHLMRRHFFLQTLKIMLYYTFYYSLETHVISLFSPFLHIYFV